jgi:hypothetical protein
MAFQRCPKCGGPVGDTSTVCVDCGQSFGKLESCDECKGTIPRGQTCCPKCTPKIFQFMGIRLKKKKPKVSGSAVVAAARPLKKVKHPTMQFGRMVDDGGTSERGEQRKVHAGAVLLGLALAAIGGATAFHFLPKGIDARLAPLFGMPVDATRSTLLYAAYAALGLGALEFCRGLAHRPRRMMTCAPCHSQVAAFLRPFRFVCERCGRTIGARFLNGLLVLVMSALVLGAIAAAAWLGTR